MTDWITPRNVAELGRIHAEGLRCAFCKHEPALPIAACWCPICIAKYRIDFYTETEYDAYTRECLMHGMAPPHADWPDEETWRKGKRMTPEKESTLRVDRLKELQEVLKRSKTFDQSHWLAERGTETDLYVRYVDVSCMTPACVAGHALVAFGQKVKDILVYEIGHEAAGLLGLTDEQAGILFSDNPYEWPRWGHKGVHKATADDAIKAIESLIQTGEVIWP